MNFFEGELRKIFGSGSVLENPSFVGRACFGDLGPDLRARAQFVTSGHADHYDVLKISILNRTNGVVDSLSLRFRDLFGAKPVPGNPYFRDGVIPHIWSGGRDFEWYAYQLNNADYQLLRDNANQYLSVFRAREQEHEKKSPPLSNRIESAKNKVTAVPHADVPSKAPER